MIWRSHYHGILSQIVDFLLTCAVLVITYYLSKWLHIINLTYFPGGINFKEYYILLMIIISIIYLFLLKQYKAYSYQRHTSLIKEFNIILKVTFIGVLLSVTLVFLIGLKDIPRIYFIVLFFLSLILFMLEKTLMFIIASYFRSKGKDRKRILVIGTDSKAKRIISIINKNFAWGLDIIGMITCNANEINTNKYGYEIFDSIDNIEAVIKKLNPQEILIAFPLKYFDRINNILEVCEREGLRVRFISDSFGKIAKNITVDNVYGLNIITFDSVKYSRQALFYKRILDVIISLIALLILSPIMIFASIAILITDGRPIFYNWHVIGLDKIPFKSWKFRTMVKNADELKENLLEFNEMEGPVFKIKNDPRVFPLGRFLRKFSIDETPQLFSVIMGDMSLVGPRPAGPLELERYQSWHRRKLSIKPGITCLWQVNGRNNINSFDEWVRLDLEYIDNWSILLDLKILLKTIPAVLKRQGAS